MSKDWERFFKTNNYDEVQKSRLTTNPDSLEGMWEFKGYYPEGCKEPPQCHTKRMGLAIDITETRTYGWHCFYTKAEKIGDTCSDADMQFQWFGYTWVHGNLIYYG